MTCNEKIGPGKKIGPARPVLVDQNWSYWTIFGIQNRSSLTKIGLELPSQFSGLVLNYELMGVAIIIVHQTILTGNCGAEL